LYRARYGQHRTHRICKESPVPKRRDLIKMTDEEIWRFIETQKTIQVVTINKDGTPQVLPLWFAIDNGKIVLETFTKSQKIVNLERDNRITVLFEDGETYNELRAVSIKGRATLIRDHDEVHRLHMAVLVRNQPQVPVDLLEKATAPMVPKKTAIVIEPDKFISWDHRKLDVAY
jgi:PPOX class probable F420-dependent enzyme